MIAQKPLCLHYQYDLYFNERLLQVGTGAQSCSQFIVDVHTGKSGDLILALEPYYEPLRSRHCLSTSFTFTHHLALLT
jgi:hypothetical protein